MSVFNSEFFMKFSNPNSKDLADKIVLPDAVNDLVNIEINNVGGPPFEFTHIHMDDLNKELMAIDIEKSSGFDHLSAKVLKDCLIGLN